MPVEEYDADDLIINRTDWRRMLARQYTAEAQRLQNAYRGVMRNLEINQLEVSAEIKRLADEGKLTGQALADRPEFVRMLGRVEAEMRDFAVLLRASIRELEAGAVPQGIQAARDMTTLSSGNAARIVLGRWVSPDPDALRALIGYADSEAMGDKLSAFGPGAAENIRDLLITGAAQGKNPRTLAGFMNQWFQVPYAWAENMTRTAQIWGFRTATHASYRANSDVLSGWMWWATLDTRTCPSCIGKHGQKFALSDTLNDHHRGRCVALPIVKGQRWADEVQTGADWFAGRPESEQRAIMGGAMFRAWKAGDVQFADLSKPYTDTVYGEMLRAASLKDLLGDGARRYYRVR